MDKITAEQVLLAVKDLTSKSMLREKIETKIEEFKEKAPTGRMSHDTEVAGIITGLQLALDILDEEGTV